MNLKNLFLKMFCVLHYIDGEEVVEEAPVIDMTEGAGEDLSGVVGGEEVTLENYMGSKDLNPEGRPLKTLNRSMFSSKEDLDEFLRSVIEGGEDPFLPAEQAPKKKGPGRPKKESNVKKESDDGLRDKGTSEAGKTGDGTEKGSDEGSETGAKEGDEVEAEQFLEELGLTIEQFQELPEKVQEKLTMADEGSVSTEFEQKYAKLEEEYTGIINDVVKLKNDPVIAARLEEKATGKLFVARDLPPVSKKETEQLLSLAEDPEAFGEAMNELMISKARDVLRIERGVLERNAMQAEREKKAAEVLRAVLEKEKRIGVSEKDIAKLADENHPEHDKFFGAGSLMEMLKRKRYSPAQIIEKGADEILEEYAKTKGWDQEKIAIIEKKAKQSLLQSLRNFKKTARTLDVGKRSAAPESSDSSTGFDKQTLVAEIASGKTARWSKLISHYEDRGDNVMVGQLTDIYEEGLRQKRSSR